MTVPRLAFARSVSVRKLEFSFQAQVSSRPLVCGKKPIRRLRPLVSDARLAGRSWPASRTFGPICEPQSRVGSGGFIGVGRRRTVFPEQWACWRDLGRLTCEECRSDRHFLRDEGDRILSRGGSQ